MGFGFALLVLLGFLKVWRIDYIVWCWVYVRGVLDFYCFGFVCFVDTCCGYLLCVWITQVLVVVMLLCFEVG